MTGRKSLLTEFERRPGPTISFGDGNKGETLGYGSIKLGNIIIENVALVEGLKHTLAQYQVNSVTKVTMHILITQNAQLSSMTSGETVSNWSKAWRTSMKLT